MLPPKLAAKRKVFPNYGLTRSGYEGPEGNIFGEGRRGPGGDLKIQRRGRGQATTSWQAISRAQRGGVLLLPQHPQRRSFSRYTHSVYF
jgi:hypothetical protein